MGEDIQALEKFFLNGRSVRTSKGQVVLRGDDDNPDIYFVGKGFIKVYSINDEGEEYLHIIYKQGDIFPLIWIFRNRRRRVFYEAMTDSVVWKLPKTHFLDYIKAKTDPVSFSVIEKLAEQFNIYADRLDNLEYRNAGERVVYRLLFLASRFGQKSDDKIIIEAPITHKLIAESINLTRESVSREIERLSKAGLIGSQNGKIIINSIEKLSQEFSEPVTLNLWGLQ
jgi:CRP/FNR family transcriptional regulator, cyclic AMP receptor protein